MYEDYENQQTQDEIYEKACLGKFDSTDKIVTFTLRIFVLLIAILSSLFVMITIYHSPKKRFWPFKYIFAQVAAELIDLTLALLFSVNSPCHYNLCTYVGYIMHCNWLASLELLCLFFFTYFCMIKFEHIFFLIQNYQMYIMLVVYIFPYLYLALILPSGFGPAGWLLKNGEFNYIFCGFIQRNTLIIYWIVPVSILFILDIVFTGTLQYYYKVLCSQRELAFSAKRIKFQIWLPLTYFMAWIINFIIRAFDPSPNTQRIQEKMGLIKYIFYLLSNLGFELHLTLGAFFFYLIYDGFLDISKIWRKIFRIDKQRLVSSASINELSQNDD